MVNPRACHETELAYDKAGAPKRIAVVGAGPGGLAYATVAAARGHKLTLYEAEDRLGGQFNMAKIIPGKGDYAETIRYYARRLELLGVEVHLSTRVAAKTLIEEGFDEVVLATGVTPRVPDIDGIDHPKVLSYADVLLRGAEVGKRVAIIGAGGIGFDVAEYVSFEGDHANPELEEFCAEWGIDRARKNESGLDPSGGHMSSAREIHMLQRKPDKPGRTLGLTTGWVHRLTLARKHVHFVTGVTYRRVDDEGLHYTADGEDKVLEVDTIIVCAGQVSRRELKAELDAAGVPTQLIGGADVAAELDARRAIEQASRLAASA